MAKLRSQVDASFLSMIAFVTVVVTVGWSAFTHEQYRSVNRLLSDQHGVALEAAWRATSRMYRISAAIMVDDLSRHPAVTDWLEQANEADEPGRERLRGWFRSLLRPDYLRLHEEGFEIFQVHTADGRALLRFHDDRRHGDEVTLLRPSVALAHAGRESVVAVERDGDDPALRHVFPRVYQDRLLGSIELGVPFLRIQEQLGRILAGNLFALIVRAPQMGPGMRASGLHETLVIAERQLPPDTREAIEAGRLTAVFEDLAGREAVRDAALGSERRTFSVLVGDEGYFASFMPLANEGAQDAWLLAVHPARELIATRSRFLLQGLVGGVGIGLLGIALGMLHLAARRRRQQEQRYRDVVTNIQEVIFRTDRSGHLTFLNPAWESLTAFAVADTLGRRAIEFIHPEDRSRFVAFLQPLLRREQEVLRDEFRYLRADGGQCWVEVFVQLSRDERGQANGVYGTLMDVSERRRVTDALRAERDLFAAGPAIAFIWRNEPGWPVEYISSNVVAGLGYAPEQFLDPEFRFASIIHPEDLTRIEREGREHRELRRTSFEMNYRIRNRDGEYRWFREYSMPGWDETHEGAPLRIRGYLLDETATVEAREALEQSGQRLAWILEGADVGTWEWDIQAGVFAINERWAAMLGYALDELVPLGTTAWRGLMHPEDRDKCLARMHAYLDEGSGYYEGEHRLRHKDGSWLWVLMRGRVLAHTAEGEPRLMCGTQMDITRRKAAEAHAAHLAYYDELTGLANRRMLLEQLRHALASSARTHYFGALLFIDLDNFKNLNDTLGHDYGDLLLREVAARLRSIVRGSDSVARLGGDEFVVLFEELDTDDDGAITNAERAVRKVLAVLSEPYVLKEYEHHLTPSIGVTLFGSGRETSETLMKKADLAMYQAKAEGKGTFRFFDPDMQAAAEHQRQVEVALRRGLDESQFLVAYQPIVGVGGTIVAVEALLRWKHPERGMVPPGEFIPVAEKAGLIAALGRWVLQTACGQLAEWKSDPQRAALSMAVNVSPVQFLQPDFVDEVLAVLRESGVDGRRLRLEITESMLLDNVEEAIGRMSALREHGVSFSLDDFGTGYSSLNYLKRLPISVLKIDQSFVRDIELDPNDASIVQTILAMAHSLGLKVVAEGVESAGQRDFLIAHGCDFLQGYLLYRPMFIESLEGVLA